MKPKNINDSFIGKGEKTAVKVLKKIFPKSDIQIQIPFKKLMKGDFIGSLTERQEKQTVDIVVYNEKETIYNPFYN